jgi:hypothetical protein
LNFRHFLGLLFNLSTALKTCFIVTSVNSIAFRKYWRSNRFEFPNKIIEQIKIFENQKEKYININNKVAVLSAFPMFLLDYYGVKLLKKL